jgi:secreted trypsin-like serine protease
VIASRWPGASRILSALWAAILVVACGRGGPGGSDSANGRVAVAESVPDDVQAYAATGAFIIRPFGRPILVCTGTLVTPRVVVTAAHCVARKSTHRLEFNLGRDVGQTPESAGVPIRRVFVNPQYDLRASGSLHDIALVELEASLGTSTEQVLSPDEASRVLGPGSRVELVGYGGRAANGSPLAAKGATRARITSLRADEMTIGGPGEPQGCEGDSGGPAFALVPGGGRRLVAVTSRSANAATECEDGSIHTRVDVYASWLVTTLATIEADAEGGIWAERL